MLRFVRLLCCTLLVGSGGLVPLVWANEAAPTNDLPLAIGLGEPGALNYIIIESGHPNDRQLVLRGGDAREQLVVTGHYETGQTRDLTHRVTFESSPPGIVQIDETGLVTPLADGQTTVAARSAEGIVGTLELEVAHLDDQIAINFPNQVVPIFTKLGCNSGGCHGKASGQNGFKLSLLGFEPREDYEYLVKEGRGRRVFPAAPERSLLLQKGVNATPHGGGQRLTPDSHEFRLIERWIRQGMPYGRDDDPVVVRLSVYPEARTMSHHDQQQLTAVAHYSDGSTEDVTRMVQLEPNDPEMAEASVTGLVNTLDLTGDVAIMARYQSHVAVFRASIPLGASVEDAPEPRNFIDELVFGKLHTLGVPPSAVCDDATFLRRVTIDVAGRLPTPDETTAFVNSTDPDKRDRWIDELLNGGDYADFFANKWSAILRNKRRNANYTRGTFAFHSWIRHSLYINRPYDEFVTDILAASGEVGQHPPVAWYREVKDVHQQVEDTAQLFLGLRIQCARCHHHPFEKWSEDDYYGFAAFFTQVKRKPGEQPDEERIFHGRGVATSKNPKTGRALKPTGLGAEPLEISADRDPRFALAEWMSDPANPFFAPALVNRYWKHFFDRGLVDPEDDMRVTNPASNPELLAAVSQHFIDSGFDLKELVRTICRSHTYQLASEPNEYNVSDKQNYSRYYPKRLTAEVLLDALNQVTKSRTDFGNLPTETRAVQLPDQEGGGYFLTVFGRPQADTACECERSQEANLAQSLHLLNSAEVQGKLTAGEGRAALLAKDENRSHEERIAELYLWVFSRPPDDDETAIALGHIEKCENKQQAYEDIMWALVNTKEFLFNH